LQETSLPIIVVYPDSIDTLRKQFQLPLPDRLLIVSDPSEELSRELNAVWSPRLYVLEEGRLSALQSRPGEKVWSAGE
jgi:hypothetical protein